MNWIKHVIIDLAATAFIISAVLMQQPWMRYAIIVYTVLLLVTQLSTFADAALRRKASMAPIWFYHINYAVAILALMRAEWHWLAGAWMIIWVVAWYTNLQAGLARKKTVKSKQK